VRRYLALEKIRITAEDLQGGHPRKVAFMPRTGQVMVKKLRLQQDQGVAEREQALARQTAEARAERLARARERVELFSAPASPAAKPRIELFGAVPGASAGAKPAAPAKPRIELFGASPRPTNNNARTAEEA
jgi:chemotaxis protein CheD